MLALTVTHMPAVTVFTVTHMLALTALTIAQMPAVTALTVIHNTYANFDSYTYASCDSLDCYVEVNDFT